MVSRVQLAPPQVLAPPLNSENIGTPRWQLAVKLHHFATSMEGAVSASASEVKKTIAALYQIEAEIRGQSAEGASHRSPGEEPTILDEPTSPSSARRPGSPSPCRKANDILEWGSG
jgi:hypothetical protein